MSTSKKLEGKPVIFIAVNSGNDPKMVESYLKSVNVDWPAIADTDRSFEKAMGLKPLSLSNVWQSRVITPDGKISYGGNIESLASTAKWKVEPADIPATLKPAWEAFEFGDYAAAIPAIKRSVRSRDEATKAAAEKMNAVIESELNSAFDAATKQVDLDKFVAYKAFSRIADQYKGYPKATEASAEARKLARDKSISDEVRANSALKKAQTQLASRSRSQRRAAISMLKAIADRFANTEAGGIAKKLAADAEEQE